ncbi:hypothetical protein NDU88_006401 [Pleurodeles waltl]|uniref:Uncharacterized protein n=1 Tax=Pleurodeles waltl TaxID=8319 RepID=A0AAV7VPK8_PLEWA|nr:hypothetical protein NDU88_006401 [Pleurodeles waltl]
MAAGSSNAAKESGACSFRLPPSKEKVHSVERVCSILFTTPQGAKWQLMALMPLRSLGLAVSGSPQARKKFVPLRGFAASFVPRLWA